MKQIFKKIIAFLLKIEAQLVLKKYKPKIVAVTGSVGKTSTKDAIYSVLATTHFVRKSSKSFNSEIGVPLTILGLQNAWNDPLSWMQNLFDGAALILFPNKYPDWLVIEVGADRPGDISSISSWLCPDVAVVTRLSDVPVHIEFFNSAEQIRLEKSQLVLAVKKTGTVILNADDKLVSSMRPLSKGRVITYGIDRLAKVSGSNFEFTYGSFGMSNSGSNHNNSSFPTGVSFQVTVEGKTFPVKIEGVLGKQQMSIALAALAVAEALKIPIQKAVKALSSNDLPPGRMKILSGINETCIIDDTYNSSPVAAAEALETLKNVSCSGRKIALLGDMLELGEYTQAEHVKLGNKVAGVADAIYAVGTRSRAVLTAAIAAGFPKDRAFSFDDSVSAGEALLSDLQPGDIVLAKGSQSIRMEKAVAMIMAEQERAGEFLVRQEEEWKNR